MKRFVDTLTNFDFCLTAHSAPSGNSQDCSTLKLFIDKTDFDHLLTKTSCPTLFVATTSRQRESPRPTFFQQ